MIDGISRLGPQEQQIVQTIISRLERGQTTYGEWSVDDGRNNPAEALAEVLDALAYIAAELVRLSCAERR